MQGCQQDHAGHQEGLHQGAGRSRHLGLLDGDTQVIQEFTDVC